MLDENLDYEMAARRGRSRRVRSISLVLIYLFVCIHQGKGHVEFTSIYKSADHYWPMKNISDNTSSDVVGLAHASIQNGGEVNITSLFGPSVILDGLDDCIMLDLLNEDCTNTPSQCHSGFTITFWLYYIRGEFILCTGTYVNKNKGPGIMLIYNEEKELFILKISTQRYTWGTETHLLRGSWVHVAFTWTTNEGIQMYHNGEVVPHQINSTDETAFDEPENSGWSIGRPNEIFKLKNFGHFGISHIALWLRELTKVEIATAYVETTEYDQKVITIINDIVKEPSQPTPTSKTAKKSKNARSAASNIFTSAGASLLILFSCLL